MKGWDRKVFEERKRGVMMEPHRDDEVFGRCPRCHRWAWLTTGLHAFLVSPCRACYNPVNKPEVKGH